MKQSIWTKTYDVNTIVLDSSKRIGLWGMLNLLQDIAWLHAEHLGWGYEDLIKRNTIWVLARQKLVMRDWPVWGDAVTIKTWPRGGAGALATRDFEIYVEERKLGECTTSWLTLNWTTRRPQKLDRDSFRLENPAKALGFDAQKIAARSDLKPATTFLVRNSDLDVNGHVNNTRYAQWIVDTMMGDELAASRIEEYEINFLSETGVGDCVVIEKSEPEGGCCQYQGRRQDEDKPAFVARLTTRPR